MKEEEGEPTCGARGGGDGCEGGGRVGGCAFAARDGVVLAAAVVGVPEAFQPLQEFEVVPAFLSSMLILLQKKDDTKKKITDRTQRDSSTHCILHLTSCSTGIGLSIFLFLKTVCRIL
jgi:hypothetical protein